MTNYFNPLKDEEHLTYEASAVLHAACGAKRAGTWP